MTPSSSSGPDPHLQKIQPVVPPNLEGTQPSSLLQLLNVKIYLFSVTWFSFFSSYFSASPHQSEHQVKVYIPDQKRDLSDRATTEETEEFYDVTEEIQEVLEEPKLQEATSVHLTDLPVEILKVIMSFNSIAEMENWKVNKQTTRHVQEIRSQLIAKLAGQHADFLIANFEYFLWGTVNPEGIVGDVYVKKNGDLDGLEGADRGYSEWDSKTGQLNRKDNESQEAHFRFELKYQWTPDKDSKGPFISLLPHQAHSHRRGRRNTNSFRLAQEVFEIMIDNLNAKALEAWKKTPVAKSVLPWQEPAWLMTLMR